MSLVVRFLSGAGGMRRYSWRVPNYESVRIPCAMSSCIRGRIPPSAAAVPRFNSKMMAGMSGSTGEYPVLLNQATLVDERRIRSGDVLRMSETGPDLLISIERHVPKRPAVTEPIRHLAPLPARRQRPRRYTRSA